jgi:hypothetical protein
MKPLIMPYTLWDVQTRALVDLLGILGPSIDPGTTCDDMLFERFYSRFDGEF